MIGYLRVSTEEQASTGGGIAAQRERIERECEARSWAIDFWATDDASGKNMNRPALAEALELLAVGAHDTLVVAKLDRLSRSVHDCTGIMQAATVEGWALVSLDPLVDMTTPYGRAMAQMAAVFAELERELIGMRTREAMQALREADLAAGKPSRFGRPALLHRGDTAVELMLELHARGWGPQAIANRLNRDGHRNTAGRPWHHDSVRKVVRRFNVATVATSTPARST